MKSMLSSCVGTRLGWCSHQRSTRDVRWTELGLDRWTVSCSCRASSSQARRSGDPDKRKSRAMLLSEKDHDIRRDSDVDYLRNFHNSI